MRIIQSCAWAPRVALHPSSFGHDLSFHGSECLLNSGHSRRPDQLACERQVKTRRTIGRSDHLMSARCLVSNSDSRRREFRIRHHPGVALRGSEIQKLLTSNALAFSTLRHCNQRQNYRQSSRPDLGGTVMCRVPSQPSPILVH